jgi:hypothetical protein
MFDALQIALALLSLALLLLAIGHIARNRAPGRVLLGGLALLELGLVVQLVMGVVRLVGTDRDVSGVVYIGYLLGILLVVPAAVVWSLAERSRSGTAVLAVGLVVVPVLILRLQQIWAGG